MLNINLIFSIARVIITKEFKKVISQSLKLCIQNDFYNYHKDIFIVGDR